MFAAAAVPPRDRPGHEWPGHEWPGHEWQQVPVPAKSYVNNPTSHPG